MARLHEAYESLQAVREIKQLAELREAFDALFGSDERESWSWSIGDEPADRDSLLDLPESPTSPGPGLPLGWGDDAGSARDPQDMVHMPTDQGRPFGPGPAPGRGRDDEGSSDAFARMGWVQDTVTRTLTVEEGTEADPLPRPERTVAETWGPVELGGHIGTSASIRHPDGSEVRVAHTRTADGRSERVVTTFRDGRGGVIRITVERTIGTPPATTPPVENGEDYPEDYQPDERDDGSWFSPFHPNAWATFLAWYTHHRGPEVRRPGDDFDTGPDDGSSSSAGSAAPRVGIEAVINPGDGTWAPTVPGGGGTSGGGRPDDPFPIDPPSKN
jgi:hypothetical protein